jgi:tripeptide aminopeptidase
MKDKTGKLYQQLEMEKENWLNGIIKTREMVLSNLAMISHVPALEFKEGKMASTLIERFIAGGIPEPHIDDMNNAIGEIPGKTGEKDILIFSHIDHRADINTTNTLTITKDRIIGQGVPEDTIALATMITLPDVLKRLNLTFDNNIVLLASARYHDRGELEGIRYFLKKNKAKFDYAINLVGTPIGTVNYSSLSRTRCDITCDIDVEQTTPWGKTINTSAIFVMNEIINRLCSIPLPLHPKTVINLGKIAGGDRHSTISTKTTLKIEILSEDDSIMTKVIEDINDNCVDIGAKYDVTINCDFFGRHRAGGLTYSHPFVKSAVKIVNLLGYRPIITYNNSELAIPLTYGIPSVALGITTGVFGSGDQGYIDIGPIPRGILQIIMLLYAIDRGYCDG